MLNSELPTVSDRVVRTPRVAVIVDGGDCAWRSLAWAVGYAGARGSTHIEIVPFTRSWDRLAAAGQIAMLATNLPPVDHAASRRSISEIAQNLCNDGGVQGKVANDKIGTARELRRLLRQLRPDFVVVSRTSTLSWMTARRVLSGLTKEGVPVIVIP